MIIKNIRCKKGGAVIHAGFMTYALIALIIFIAIYFIAPSVAMKITEAISSVAYAIKG